MARFLYGGGNGPAMEMLGGTDIPLLPQLADSGASPSAGPTLHDLLAQYATLSQAAQQEPQILTPQPRSGVEKVLTYASPLINAWAQSRGILNWKRRRAAFLGQLAGQGIQTALGEVARPRLIKESVALQQKAAEQERFNRMAKVAGIAPDILRAQAEVARANREAAVKPPGEYVTDETGNLVRVTGTEAQPVMRQEPVLGTMPMRPPLAPAENLPLPPTASAGTGIGAPTDLGLGLNWAGILGPELPGQTTQVPTGGTRNVAIRVQQKPTAPRGVSGDLSVGLYNEAFQRAVKNGQSEEEAHTAGLAAVREGALARHVAGQARGTGGKVKVPSHGSQAEFDAVEAQKSMAIDKAQWDFENSTDYRIKGNLPLLEQRKRLAYGAYDKGQLKLGGAAGQYPTSPQGTGRAPSKKVTMHADGSYTVE
ncbi:MAG: hypothetical protein ABSA41_17060 [Terriglobia bacterium]